MATETKKQKPLFPKITRGGYTARIRFFDEARGERYFDAEWSVFNFSDNCFALTRLVNYRGEYTNTTAERIGNDIRVGDTIYVSPRLWKQTGRPRDLPGQTIKVTSITVQPGGVAVIGY